MINTKTGEIIKRPEGILIRPMITPRRFNNLKFKMRKRVDRFQIDYGRHKDVHYMFSTLDEGGNTFEVFLTFSSNQKVNWEYGIRVVSFNNMDLAKRYSDFYERLEVLKQWNESWMEDNLGGSPEMDYWWGRIISPPIDIKVERSALYVTYDYEAVKKQKTT